MIESFLEAGVFAVLSIAVILWITLRNLTHVLLTLVPLMVAAMLTLEVMVLIGMAMNFANIIALPLLLGIGVAVKIYYILAWRRGATNLLQIDPDACGVFLRLHGADGIRQPLAQ